VGILLGAIARKRWLTLAGLGVIFVGAIPPWPRIVQQVSIGLGLVLLLAQILVSVRASLAENRRTRE